MGQFPSHFTALPLEGGARQGEGRGFVSRLPFQRTPGQGEKKVDPLPGDGFWPSLLRSTRLSIVNSRGPEEKHRGSAGRFSEAARAARSTSDRPGGTVVARATYLEWKDWSHAGFPSHGGRGLFSEVFWRQCCQRPAISSILRSWTSYPEHTHPQASFKAFRLLRRTFQPFSDSQKTQSMSSNGRIGWLGSTMSLGLRRFICSEKANSTISGSFSSSR